MYLTLVLKGSKTSGWFAPPRGDHSGDKHRAVGSGKSVKRKIRVVGKKAARHKNQEGVVYHHAKSGEQLPSKVRNAEGALILYKPGAGLYVGNIEGEPIKEHASLLEAMGDPRGNYDTWTRLYTDDDGLHAWWVAAGAGGFKGSKRKAERKVSAAAKAMIASGYNPNAVLNWIIDTGVTIKVKLGDA